MNGKKESFILSYLERAFNPQNVDIKNLRYRKIHEYNKDRIIKRYDKIVNAITEKVRGVKVLKRKRGLESLEIYIAGPDEEVKKAAGVALVDFSIPPGTKIVLPEAEIGLWGTSEEGYKIGKEIATGMGHRVTETGEILRKGFEC